MKNGINYTKRIRIKPDLAYQLRLRMSELGFHPEQHLHLGQLTVLFTQHKWIMVSKSGHGRSAIYPPDKTMSDVVNELGDW